MEIEKELKETPEAFWITTDKYPVAIVKTDTGDDPYIFNRGKTVYFAYRKTDALRSALQKYKDNVPMPCRDLLESLKRITGDLTLQRMLSG